VRGGGLGDHPHVDRIVIIRIGPADGVFQGGGDTYYGCSSQNCASGNLLFAHSLLPREQSAAEVIEANPQPECHCSAVRLASAPARVSDPLKEPPGHHQRCVTPIDSRCVSRATSWKPFRWPSKVRQCVGPMSPNASGFPARCATERHVELNMNVRYVKLGIMCSGGCFSRPGFRFSMFV